MGQITKATIAMIRAAAERNEPPALTAWEYQQLAHMAERCISTPSALPAQAVGEWISVKDRLPTHNYSVLGVVVDGPFVVDDGSDDRMRDVVSYEPSRGWLQHDGNDSVVVTVTHWQDLPKLP